MEKLFEEKCRQLIREEEYEECRRLVEGELILRPDSPVPQNLLGILDEKNCDKEKAIRHYRASYALDPSYRPAIWNLERLGTGDVGKKVAYTEKDCR